MLWVCATTEATSGTRGGGNPNPNPSPNPSPDPNPNPNPNPKTNPNPNPNPHPARLNVSLIRLLAAGASRHGGADAMGRVLRCMVRVSLKP